MPPAEQHTMLSKFMLKRHSLTGHSDAHGEARIPIKNLTNVDKKQDGFCLEYIEEY